MTVLGPQPAPLCRFKGVRGEIEIPPRFSLGGRGDILFAPQRDAANRRRDAPPIFFLRHQKENAPCTVEKKKCLGMS